MSDTKHKTYVPVEPGTFPEEPEANHVKVEVFYSKGGVNYFTYKTDPRGYYVALRPVKLSNGPVFASESFLMFGTSPMAGKLLLLAATRLNRKTLDALAAKVLAKATELAELAKGGDKTALLAGLTALKEAA